MLLSAFLVAWAAEAAQFLISQGLALADPRVAADAADLPSRGCRWEAGRNPERAQSRHRKSDRERSGSCSAWLAMIYFVFAAPAARRRTACRGFTLEPEARNRG